ncbi:hypothetical protein FUAX_03680 [Fulvitalea axinellae]|uniref:DUF721 domain-containing protein n=1 Tax=Fulvitalea axinellae TaxID=1182444 RepID=A0AAU9CGQ3_9BACT|nr:hypothetical protein FUAX_03680 [Fulvitalea axinellae]
MTKYTQKSKFGKKSEPRKNDVVGIRESVEGMLQAFKLKKRFDETMLVSSWEELMGRTIAAKTSELAVRNGVLFVRITSAPLKQELNYRKADVLDRFREEYGHDIVTDVVFM